MGTADGGFRTGSRRGFRGEPMAEVHIAVRAHGSEGVLSGIATHARIKPLISSAEPPPPVRDRPGPQPTARPRAGARDGGPRSAAAGPRFSARGKEGGPV